MPRKKTNKLTNYRLWKSLDEITKEKQTTETTIKFAELLKKGYEEDLGILTRCLYDLYDSSTVYHAYVNMPEGRLMLCYTSKTQAEKEWRSLPPEDGRRQGCKIMSLQHVLNNMFHKQVIFGLCFNSDDPERSYIIPKPILEMLMPGPKPKPKGFKEPD